VHDSQREGARSHQGRGQVDNLITALEEIDRVNGYGKTSAFTA
jgi:hypothetical protein